MTEVFELLEDIRRRPYSFLNNEKSLKLLRAFLAGYDLGIIARGDTCGIFGDLRPFNNWVAAELGFTQGTSGWHNMIRARSNSDEEAFDYFYELLDRYRSGLRNSDERS